MHTSASLSILGCMTPVSNTCIPEGGSLLDAANIGSRQIPFADNGDKVKLQGFISRLAHPHHYLRISYDNLSLSTFLLV